MNPSPPHLPLLGVRIVDLTWGWAGPASTLLLAQLGAEVIKIEGPGRPDWWRLYVPGGRVNQTAGDGFIEWSPRFNSVNLNKKGVTLDLSKPEGRAVLLQLASQSDIVVNNFSARVMDNLGIRYQELARLNPRIIYLSSTLSGNSDPWRHMVGYAGNIQGLAGLTHLNHYPEESVPYQLMPPIGDPVTGEVIALSVLLALKRRQQTGMGAHIDLSAAEANLLFCAPLLSRYLYGREPDTQDVVVHCTGDNKGVVVSLVAPRDFERIASAIRPSSPTAPPRNRAEVAQLLEMWAEGLTSAEAVSQLRAAGLIAEAIHSPDVVLEDPQLSHRSFFTPLTREPNGTHRYPTGWFHIEGGEHQPTPAPRLGEHNALLRRLLPAGSDVP